MPIVGSKPKSNFFEIKCLPSLSTSLKKIQSKVQSLSSGQHFLHYMSTGDKTVGTSVNSPICPHSELVQDFTVVLITCKADDDSIKPENAIVRISFF